MAEVPEHLLRRSKERRKALGLPVPGEEDAPGDRRARRLPSATRAAEAAPAAASARGRSERRER